MVMDGNDSSFFVKMVNGTHLHTAGGHAEGGVLDALEFLDGGGGGVWKPDRDGVGEEGGDEGFVCEDETLLALSPGGANKIPQDFEMGEAPETREKVNLG